MRVRLEGRPSPRVPAGTLMAARSSRLTKIGVAAEVGVERDRIGLELGHRVDARHGRHREAVDLVEDRRGGALEVGQLVHGLEGADRGEALGAADDLERHRVERLGLAPRSAAWWPRSARPPTGPRRAAAPPHGSGSKSSSTSVGAQRPQPLEVGGIGGFGMRVAEELALRRASARRRGGLAAGRPASARQGARIGIARRRSRRRRPRPRAARSARRARRSRWCRACGRPAPCRYESSPSVGLSPTMPFIPAGNAARAGGVGAEREIDDAGRHGDVPSPSSSRRGSGRGAARCAARHRASARRRGRWRTGRGWSCRVTMAPAASSRCHDERRLSAVDMLKAGQAAVVVEPAASILSFTANTHAHRAACQPGPRGFQRRGLELAPRPRI